MIFLFKMAIEGLRAGYHFARGVMRIERMHKPTITIFGGAEVPEKEWLAQQAYNLAHILAEHDISILTGGGPGIMQAANYGAGKVKRGEPCGKWSVGVGIEGLDKDLERVNVEFFDVKYFFIRKLLLMNYSSAFVIFPGGIGTMDEIFDLFNNFKHHKVKRVPVILFDSSYWRPIVEWYEKAIEGNYIFAESRDFFKVSDSVEDIAKMLIEAIKEKKPTALP